MAATLARSNIVEIHNRYAIGVDLYTHSDDEFRAPYINLYKSSGVQTAPTPVMFTGYELDSIGGINFGGWDGSKYFAGSLQSILKQMKIGMIHTTAVISRSTELTREAIHSKLLNLAA